MGGTAINSINDQNRLPEIFLSPFRVDEVTSTLVYVGYINIHNQNADETKPIWRIKKISQSGSVWKIEYADGDSAFTKVWADRALLVYR